MEELENQTPEEQARRTLDLLDQYPRQAASPWMADRVAALLRRPAASGQRAPGWQWALAAGLLTINALGWYLWTEAAAPATEQLAQAVGDDYGLVADDETVYPFISPDDY